MERVSLASVRRLYDMAARGTAALAFAAVGLGHPAATAASQNLPEGRHPGDVIYHPSTSLDAKPSSRKALRAANRDLQTDGRSVAVVAPDVPEQEELSTFYIGGQGQAPDTPRLSEIAILRDRDYFMIENATDHPLDLRFVAYAVRAARSWLHAAMSEDGNLDIGGHTLAQVEPRPYPHVMVMTARLPDMFDDAPWRGTAAAVTTSPDGIDGMTRSFVWHYGIPDPSIYDAVATEICQSMVHVINPEVVPGQEAAQAAMQAAVAAFNPPAADNLRLAGQESVCNKVGDEIRAAYDSRKTAAWTVPSGVIDTSLHSPWWEDDGLPGSQLPEFIRFAASAQHADNAIVTLAGANLPSARYYANHEK